MDKMEAVAANLQQRIGQLVSQYETDIAVLRTDAAQEIQSRDATIKELQEKIESLESKESGDKGTKQKRVPTPAVPD